MAAQYIEITAEDFREFFEKHAWRFIEEDIQGTNEICYTLTANDRKIRMVIYSSIPKHRGTARKKGADAIRVVLMRLEPETDKYHPIKKMRRVHRVKNWKENLNSRIEEAIKQVNKGRCPYCDDILVLRTGMHGEFYACYSWHKTGCQGKAKV